MSFFTTGAPGKAPVDKSQKIVTEFVFKQLTPDKIKETITVLNDAFVDQNPVWLKLKVKREEGLKIMEARVKRC